MDNLRKKPSISKSKKNTTDMEVEDEIVDYEHINKDQDFQTVTFDFLEPDHKFHGHLYTLLKKSFSFVGWDINPLLESICEQNELGIFLGIAEDEDRPVESQASNKIEENEIYAVLTILNFKLIQANNFLSNLAKFIIANAPAEAHPLLSSIFLERPEKTGLLINDRVINLPFLVVPNVFEQFLEDKQFIDTEYSLEEQYMYNFDFLVYFVPTYMSQSQKKGKEGESKISNNAVASTLYYKQEDKNFMKKAIFNMDVPHKLNDEFKLTMIIMKYEDFLLMTTSKSLFN